MFVKNDRVHIFRCKWDSIICFFFLFFKISIFLLTTYFKNFCPLNLPWCNIKNFGHINFPRTASIPFFFNSCFKVIHRSLSTTLGFCPTPSKMKQNIFFKYLKEKGKKINISKNLYRQELNSMEYVVTQESSNDRGPQEIYFSTIKFLKKGVEERKKKKPGKRYPGFRPAIRTNHLSTLYNEFRSP